ncbi:hypothetical protein E2C01_094724 [Portunus trituberculatus]|uniref:Uncharacterized protein n=1 Tax=Portunus trituberculatus TaxID=210409 RepID=A0A5B7K2G0_PORTR|nr:hypothetical protein [Portunus trituberculatus]
MSLLHRYIIFTPARPTQPLHHQYQSRHPPAVSRHITSASS